MENLIPIFIALTGAAVVLQAGILAAMYLTMRKGGAQMEALAAEVRAKAIPALESATLVLTEARPKLAVILDNVEHTSSTLRAQVTRLDATANDALDRGRLQVIRADELVTRTLDRIEKTTDMVHNTVVSPVRQISGVISGITAGLEYLLGSRAGRNGSGHDAKQAVPQDEMFI
jgi:hypothetical protein